MFFKGDGGGGGGRGEGGGGGLIYDRIRTTLQAEASLLHGF